MGTIGPMVVPTPVLRVKLQTQAASTLGDRYQFDEVILVRAKHYTSLLIGRSHIIKGTNQLRANDGVTCLRRSS